jgi:hypothetical protein
MKDIEAVCGKQKSNIPRSSVWDFHMIYIEVYLFCNPLYKGTGYWLGDRGIAVRVPVVLKTFISAYPPDRLWDPLSLLSNGSGCSVPECKAAVA